MKNIRKYLTNNLAYGEAGHRDQQKQMEDVVIRNRKGRLHFIRFPTSVMRAFLDLAKEKGMAETISTGKHHITRLTELELEYHSKYCCSVCHGWRSVQVRG